MANDCLVTKLKSTVENAELPVLGCLKMKKYAGGIGRMQLSHITTVDVIYTIEGDCYFTDSTGSQNLGKTFTKSAGTNIVDKYISSESGYIIIPNKYDITEVDLVNGDTPCLGFDITELKYNTRVNVLQISRSAIWGDVSSLAFPYVRQINTYLNKDYAVHGDFRKWIESTNGNFERLNLRYNSGQNQKISGDALTLIAQQSNLTEAVLTKENCDLYGNFDSLGNCSLTTLTIFNQSNLAGSIEGFVAAARAKSTPRTTGSVTINGLKDTQVTWKGARNYSMYTQHILSWTATTITFNGETIEA